VEEFLKRFWAIAVSIAALVGAYLGAVPLHLVWVFWLACGVAAIAASASLLIPRSIELATRIRNYPILLERAGVQETEIERLQKQVSELQIDIDKRWSDGLNEGRQQIIGSVQAQAADPIALTGIALRQERLLIIATPEGKQPNIGARYSVEVTLTGDVMGVVETRAYDEERKIIILECVDARVQIFWERLAQSATLDPTPPQGVGLIPYSLTSYKPDRIVPVSFNLPEKNDG
jgi:hypothetical protein